MLGRAGREFQTVTIRTKSGQGFTGRVQGGRAYNSPVVTVAQNYAGAERHTVAIADIESVSIH